MDKVMHELGNTLSDQDVNAVASQHFDAQQVKEEVGFSAAVSNILTCAQSCRSTANISWNLSNTFCISCSHVLFRVKKRFDIKALQCLSVLIRCWKTSGPVSWSKLLASRSRSIRNGSSNCTRTCRNPKTVAKLSESVCICFLMLSSSFFFVHTSITSQMYLFTHTLHPCNLLPLCFLLSCHGAGYLCYSLHADINYYNVHRAAAQSHLVNNQRKIVSIWSLFSDTVYSGLCLALSDVQALRKLGNHAWK